MILEDHYRCMHVKLPPFTMNIYLELLDYTEASPNYSGSKELK
jgi:hypothetical protein